MSKRRKEDQATADHDGSTQLMPVESVQLKDSGQSRPLKRPRLPHEWAEPFLAAYAECGNITEAAAMVGIDRRLPYRLKDNDPEFADAFREAQREYCDWLRGEIRRRAQKSDTLLIFEAKARMPEYRDTNTTAVQINNGSPIVVDVVSEVVDYRTNAPADDQA